MLAERFLEDVLLYVCIVVNFQCCRKYPVGPVWRSVDQIYGQNTSPRGRIQDIKNFLARMNFPSLASYPESALEPASPQTELTLKNRGTWQRGVPTLIGFRRGIENGIVNNFCG